MTSTVSPANVESFRSLIARRLGLQFDDGKTGFLGDVLRRRVEATGHPSEVYIGRLENAPAGGELGAIAQELTVPETYFFRNAGQFRAFCEIALPDRLQARSSRRRLRILSAGCASGEEPYTIAMLVRDAIPAISRDVDIRGVDVNPAALKKAVTGRFSSWALRETTPEMQSKWFRQEGRDAVLEETLKRSVGFEKRNLADDADVEFWEPGSYDIIFCRNVIMYFTPESAAGLIARIERALAPGGYLFLGHAETLRGLSHSFHLRHTHETFYYQLKYYEIKESRDAPLQAAFHPFAVDIHAPAHAPVLEDADTWVDAIRKAAERIHALSQPFVAPVSSAASPGVVRDIGLALDLLRKERFEEALDLFNGLSGESARDADSLLLQAALLTLNGKLELAEESCRRLLEVDDLNAGAHYVLALCREATGDREAAAHHDQVALYLDPNFAMPRLHLGLLARRAGNLEAARRELGRALLSFQLEDASRLLLFGGGFSREALLNLCRAELRTCGG